MENTSEKKKEKKKKNTSEDIVQHNDNTAMIKPLLCWKVTQIVECYSLLCENYKLKRLKKKRI